MNVITPPTTEDEDEAQTESTADRSDLIELPEANTPTEDLTASPEAPATCPACGASAPADEAYCDACGAALTVQEVTLHSSVTEGHKVDLPPLPVDSLIGEGYRVQQLLAQGDCNVYLTSAADEAFIVKEAPAAPEAFAAEIAKLQRIAYPTVTTFVEKIDQGNRCYLVCTAPPSITPLYTRHFVGWREAIRAILSLCQTLQKLHDARILLNDFSGVQWNADEGRIFIYELAHAVDLPIPVDGTEDRSETVWADANFAATEVQRHRISEIGTSSDLYALAALCYQLLFGQPYALPTPDDSPAAGEDTPIVSLPPALCRSLLICLHPDPTQRPDSVEYLKDELIPLLAIQHHRWGAGSDVGQVREQNQDAYFAQSAVVYTQSERVTVGLYLVADGMGGGKAGDLASRIVVETCQKSWGELLGDMEFRRKTDSEWLSWVCGVLQDANAAIIDVAGGEEMGSTGTLCLVVNQRGYFAHIGDSRAYLIDGGEMEQLTEDHSLVAHLVRLGELTPEEAATHPQRHIIYKTLGIERDTEPDSFMRVLSTECSVLLCSDGLHGMISDDQLLRIASDENLSHAQKVNGLINLANAVGGTDNITAVYVTFG
ncbi:MAG: protein phosphatase 2C domain-containing protein [Candidatus Poribacteria bacterium]|nr:protein phosphatase 2C domain-containing protein [Candidatus Poribacteria bacterium]